MSPAETTFIQLYEEHFDDVHAFCVRRVGRDDADDAAAEVFTVAWRRIGEIESTSTRGWLFGVARKVVLNRWRSSSRRRSLRDRVRGLRSDQPDLPENIVVRRDEDNAVLRTLNQLRSADREILCLAAWEDLSGPEIAVSLGISTTAVHQRLHRAKRRFSKLLADEPVSDLRAAAEEAGA